MDEYLASAPVVSTRIIDEAREAVTRIYLRHDLVGPDHGLDMRLNAVADRVMTVGYLTYQAETELIMTEIQKFDQTQPFGPNVVHDIRWLRAGQEFEL